VALRILLAIGIVNLEIVKANEQRKFSVSVQAQEWVAHLYEVVMGFSKVFAEYLFFKLDDPLFYFAN
jgi:hypothetical protein